MNVTVGLFDGPAVGKSVVGTGVGTDEGLSLGCIDSVGVAEGETEGC